MKSHHNQRVAGSRFDSRRVLVMGLGRFGGGAGVCRWLGQQGARVTVTDLADESTLADSVAQLADRDIAFHLGRHDEGDLDAAELVVVNPAVDRHKSAFFTRILERGIPWTTEINLFLERCRGRVIGITGTTGKSTTCALLNEALTPLASQNRRVWLGGNVGGSLLGDLEAIGPHDLVILELSSFQLEAVPQIQRSPNVAVITNAWPNHLDRHGDFETYLSAKLNLFRFQQASDVAVVGSRDQALRRAVEVIASQNRARLVTVSDTAEPFQLRIPGAHNQANAACAATVAGLLGVAASQARAAMAEFPGLPHRLQHAGKFDGVDYYDDSKSTTPAGTAAALASFGRPVIVIVGGRDRGDDVSQLVEAVIAGAQAVVCMGDSGSQIARAVAAVRGDRDRPAVEIASDLADAVGRARRRAAPGRVIVLSPGAPSYGEFVNYVDRGRAFVEAVNRRSDGQ